MQATLPQTFYAPYGPPGAQPPAQAIIAAVAPQHEVGFKHSQQKSMRILSAMQIAIGIMCIIIYIVLLAIKQRDTNGYYDKHGAGFWCGGIFIIAGSLGVAAARQNRLSLIISAMILSIFSSIMLWVLLSFAAVAISLSVRNDDHRCSYERSYERFYPSYCLNYNFSGFKAADSILVILALAEFIVSVWSAVLCCRGSCKSCCSCCCYGSGYGYQPSQAIYYAPAHSNGPQVILLPHTGMVGGQAISFLSSQPASFGMQQSVVFAHPGAPVAAASAVPGYQPCVVARPPEYSSLLVGSTVQQSGAACGQSGEAAKDQIASGCQQV